MANGTAPHANPPSRWSETEHMQWKTSLPGKGYSSTIVWGDQALVSMAISTGPKKAPVYNQAEGAHDNLAVDQDHAFVLASYNRQTGNLAWKTILATVFPHEGGHDTGSLASASPLTDGQHVIAFLARRVSAAWIFKARCSGRETLGEWIPGMRMVRGPHRPCTDLI